MRKYIYPPFFSVGFIAYWFATVQILNATSSSGDYGALGIGMLILFAWLLIALPIYCTRYSKLLVDDKLGFLFELYNSVLIIVSHLMVFNFWGEILVVVCFSLWVIFWNTVPLAIRLISRKKADKSLKTDDAHLINFLLQDKKKNIIAICTTCLYILNVMISNAYSLEEYLWNTLSLVSPVAILVLLLSKNKEYYFKKWLLPLALGIRLSSNLFWVLLSLDNIDIQLKYSPIMYPIMFTVACLLTVAIAVMFVGSLLNFKYVKVFKYGALGCAVLAVVSFIRGLINVLHTAYQLIETNGRFYVNISTVIALVVSTMYYIGIYILTTNKVLSDKE